MVKQAYGGTYFVAISKIWWYTSPLNLKLLLCKKTTNTSRINSLENRNGI